jgi:hypothetical protein
MQLRKLLAAAAAALFFTASAMAQTDASATSQADSTSKSTGKSSKKKKSSKKSSSKSSKSSKSAKRSKKKKSRSASKKSVTTELQAQGPIDDGEAPQLSHQPVEAGTRGKALTITVHASDPAGVYGPVLYVRKKGLGAIDYVPLRMAPSRIVPGDYAAEVPPALTNVDGLEYYVEAWDMAGNGPARAGAADQPFSVRIDEEKRNFVPVAPTNVTIKPKGVPPAITHAAVTQALRGKPVEISARLVGETGVQGATVMFRRAGEREYRSLPMGNIGADDYTATIPASMTTTDLEYYVEAYDQYGNGPARSGSPNVPYALRLADAGPPVAAAAPPVHRRVLDDDDYDNTIFGIGIDGGAPGGGGLTLLVRPLWWLRLNAGLAYNAVGFGYRGGISLAPGRWAVTPTLNLDVGQYLSGDFTKFVTVSDPNVNVLLSNTTYSFGTAQLGLEFGSQRRFAFYIRGGITYLMSTLSANQLNAIVNGNLGGTGTTATFRGDGRFTALVPCASLGFNIFVY